MNMKIVSYLVLYLLQNGYTYKLDKNPERTTRLLTKGSIKARLDDLNEDHFNLLLNINISTIFKSYNSIKLFKLNKKISKLEFWETFRDDGFFITNEFEAYHLGYDGDCDIVEFKNFKDMDKKIKNPILKSTICHNNEYYFKPVTFDIEGYSSGIKIKAGFNLKE